jgi:hypothetical protein
VSVPSIQTGGPRKAAAHLAFLDLVPALCEVLYDIEYSGTNHGHVDLEEDHNRKP